MDKELPKGYTCAVCGKEHLFPSYVYAHWTEQITHECDCGVKHNVLRGIAIRVKSSQK